MSGGSWTVYMLRCGDGTLYTGIATDVERRLAEHEQGPRGSRYLRGRGPLQLVFRCEVADRSLASRVEHRIKGLGRAEKEKLISAPSKMHELLAHCCDGKISTG